jgi:3-dehydroquinate synthase
MKKIKINMEQNGYEIQIGPGLLDQVGENLKRIGYQNRTVVITNPNVNKLYGDQIMSDLEKAGLEASLFEVPDGEEYKSLKWAGNLYRKLSSFQAERMTPILALGGGVIGDLAGFVAATYMRGVPLIQLPTTLLAQVDSSIGGKVAVNYGRLKNTIGTFYQPKLVISDIAALKTLPVKELKNGLAEIIKYAIIRDPELFALLEQGMGRIKSRDMDLFEEVISLCAGIKADIIQKDEKDLGLRNVLNYGHTFGHAIETVSDFQISHGKAVALGMVAAALVSQRMKVLPISALDRIKTVIVRAGLPLNIPGLDIDKIMNVMGHDKKKLGGKIRFVLPKSIGEVYVTDAVDNELVKQVLEELYEETPDLRHLS